MLILYFIFVIRMCIQYSIQASIASKASSIRFLPTIGLEERLPSSRVACWLGTLFVRVRVEACFLVCGEVRTSFDAFERLVTGRRPRWQNDRTRSLCPRLRQVTAELTSRRAISGQFFSTQNFGVLAGASEKASKYNF